MDRGRLEAFSDGVMAVILTIMVLELKAPDGHDFFDLESLVPTFISYVISFVYIGIYWNNHHHLMKVVDKVNGPILWANHHLLFWLSLVPFCTAWMAKNHFAGMPVALYSLVLLFAAVSYFILTKALLFHHGKESRLAQALGSDFKGKISIAIYILAILVSFFYSWLSYALDAVVALIWFIPDSRMEKVLSRD